MYDGFSGCKCEDLIVCCPSGPYPAAQQPFGFFRGDSTRPAVVLKPHQLEALTLLKAAEARPYGFNSVVWKEVQLNGRSW